jgi:hypothetical protein
MHEVTAKPRTGGSGPVLAGLFSRAAGFARADALLKALLWGGATSWVVIAIFGKGGCSAIAWRCIPGVLVALVAYLAIAPDSGVTACLVSARKRFLDNQVTRAQCRQMRKKCLRKSLLY